MIAISKIMIMVGLSFLLFTFFGSRKVALREDLANIAFKMQDIQNKRIGKLDERINGLESEIVKLEMELKELKTKEE